MVFVVDAEQGPLAPCHAARARQLLSAGKAAVWRRYPFTIILKRLQAPAAPELWRVKIDPGSKVTGLAVVNDASGQVACAAESADMPTGDIVRAVVPPPLVKAGVHVGRLAVRASGSCNIRTHTGTVQSVNIRYCQPPQRGAGYTNAERCNGATYPSL